MRDFRHMGFFGGLALAAAMMAGPGLDVAVRKSRTKPKEDLPQGPETRQQRRARERDAVRNQYRHQKGAKAARGFR